MQIWTGGHHWRHNIWKYSYLFEPLQSDLLSAIVAEHHMYLNLENILDGKDKSLSESKVRDVIHEH